MIQWLHFSKVTFSESLSVHFRSTCPSSVRCKSSFTTSSINQPTTFIALHHTQVEASIERPCHRVFSFSESRQFPLSHFPPNQALILSQTRKTYHLPPTHLLRVRKPSKKLLSGWVGQYPREGHAQKQRPHKSRLYMVSDIPALFSCRSSRSHKRQRLAACAALGVRHSWGAE